MKERAVRIAEAGGVILTEKVFFKEGRTGQISQQYSTIILMRELRRVMELGRSQNQGGKLV